MKIIFNIFLVSILFFCSCLPHYEDDYTSSLIIEGWIEDNDYPVVHLGQSINLNSSDKDLSDYIIRWGEVTISDGTKTEVLRGRYDDHFFPPFVYTSYNMKGEAGKTYKITAKYNNIEATATTTVPSKSVTIDSSRVVHVKDSLYYIEIYFKDSPISTDYYLVSSKRLGKDLDYQVPIMGALSDHLFKEGETTKIAVYKGKNSFSSMFEDNNIYFTEGDKVNVRLMKIDYRSYLFWKSFLEYQSLASNMLFPYTAELNSNIVGGKGYWCGCLISEKLISVGP